MQLVQKKFNFQTKDKTSPDASETGGLKLVVNKVITDIPIQDLFEDGKISAGYIKGWSVLALLENPTDKDNFNSLELNNNKFEIGFVGPSGNLYQVYEIKDPTFQFGDREMDEADLKGLVDRLLLVKGIGSAEAPTEEEKVEEVQNGEVQSGEQEPAQEPKVPLDQLVASTEPQVEAVEEKEETKAEEPAPASESVSTAEEDKNPEYTRNRFALEQNGFKEYSDGDYRLFAKADAEPYLLAIHNNSVEDLPIEDMEITNELGDYFTTYNGESLVFRFTIATEVLSVMTPETQE